MQGCCSLVYQAGKQGDTVMEIQLCDKITIPISVAASIKLIKTQLKYVWVVKSQMHAFTTKCDEPMTCMTEQKVPLKLKSSY